MDLHVFLLSQDVQGEVYDYPEEFFKERIHTIRRPRPDDFQIKEAAELIKKSKKPIIIAGGGVFYSDATDELSAFCKKTQYSCNTNCDGIFINEKRSFSLSRTIGGLGGKAANNLSKNGFSDCYRN